MNMQKSSAIALIDDLSRSLNHSPSDAEEVHLSSVSEALIRDTVARDELQAEIDKQKGE